MKLLKMGALRGPNIYSHKPVVHLYLDLEEMHGRTTESITGFTERLLKLIPSLGDHHCSCGRAGGFTERLIEGTMLGHVIEHLALELQALLGYEVFYGRTRLKGNQYSVVYEYKCEEVGCWAGKTAFRLIKNLAHARGVPSLQKILLKGTRVKKAFEFGPSTQSIINAAQEKGIPIIPLNKGTSLVQLGYGRRSKKVSATITGNTSCLGVDIAGDKWQVRKLLTDQGFPVPRGEMVETLSQLYQAQSKIGFPLVVKPYNCNQGKGVSLNIQSSLELEQAFRLAKKFSKKVIIEENVCGRDYRILVVDGKVVAGSERIPPYVTGDGRQTIGQLIRQINDEPQRGYGHEKMLTKIKVDEVVQIMLMRQGYTLDSCPALGERVLLRGNSNLSTGGTAHDITDLIHSHNKELASRAANLLGLDICGIDIVAPDISLPLDGEGYFIEINAAPGIRMHHFPSSGQPRNAAGAIIDYLFPNGDAGRIPLVSVTGTNGKTTVTRFVAHILQQTGLNVGFATTEGLFFNQERLKTGDCSGPNSARDILTDPRVEAAVLETARGGLIRGGLGYDWSDVAIVTNITEDHFDGHHVKDLEDLWHVKSLLVERVREGGKVILNADDQFLSKVAKEIKGDLLLFSKEEANIALQEHLCQGGEGIFLRGNQIVYRASQQEEVIIDSRDIPITWEGRALHQVENTLAAVAAAISLGIPRILIKEALKTFDHSLNPGRLELLGDDHCRVVLDYGHNEKGFENSLQAVKKLPHSRLLGVLGMPGDRLDASIIKAGTFLAQSGFAKVFLKEDEDLRGRKPGEVAGLLESIFKQEGFKGPLEIALSEKIAIDRALDEAQEGDIVLIFYEKDPESLQGLIEEKIRSKSMKIPVIQE